MKHSSIVQLVIMYEDADCMHIITDLCKGGELFDKIIEKATNGDNGAARRTKQQEVCTKS